MHSKYLSLLMVLAVVPLVMGSQPKTEAEFVAEFREAITSRDPAHLDALTYQVGMSDDDKAMARRVQTMMLNNPAAIEGVELKPLPSDIQTVAIIRGRKIEMTNPPVGIIEASYNQEISGMQASATPYTIVDGVYYIVGSKSTDLGWQGPPDKNIGFMVMGNGQEALKIKVQWNASGVTQTRDFKEPSSTFWGQHIDSITVTSDSDDSDVTLTVLDSGESIYTSAPLKGKGTIEYKKES